MTLEEFLDEPTRPAKSLETTTPVSKAPVVIKGFVPHEDDYDDLTDEVLPEGVVKVYAGGEIVYMICTPDGRLVRMDNWFVPGITG